MKPKTIDGGFEVSIRGGVLWINTKEGSLLRITGLPRDITLDFIAPDGSVRESMNGT
jgi:hypothetical protein